MTFNNLTENIKSLTLLSSCGCNLQCEYCLINKSRNAKSEELQLNTIKALDDGSFLENSKKVLNKIHVPYSNIRKFELWGQEPTLTLHLLTKHWEDWLEAYPNVSSMMFSTNGMAYPERIVDFIKKLDQTLPNPFTLTVQFSYDGDTSTNEIRGANDQIIYDNISYVLNELNQYKFHNVEVKMYLHGVLSLEMIKRLQTTEQILDYYNNMGQFGEELGMKCLNKNVYFDSVVSLSLETPVQASTEDGILLGAFAQRSNALPASAFKTYNASLSRKVLFVPASGIQDIMYVNQVSNVDEFIDKCYASKEFFNDYITWSQGMPFCGANHGDIHLLYDGTIMTCQNHIFDRDEEALSARNDFEMIVKKALIKKNFYINPLTATDDEITRFFSIFFESKTSSYRFLLDQIITLMFWMSKANQIDARYKEDEKLLFKHALIITIFNCCIYNNRITNGTLFLRWDGFVRFFCNGYVNVVEAELNNLLNKGDKYEGNRILQ